MASVRQESLPVRALSPARSAPMANTLHTLSPEKPDRSMPQHHRTDPRHVQRMRPTTRTNSSQRQSSQAYRQPRLTNPEIARQRRRHATFPDTRPHAKMNVLRKMRIQTMNAMRPVSQLLPLLALVVVGAPPVSNSFAGDRDQVSCRNRFITVPPFSGTKCSADGSAITLPERNIGDTPKCGFRHSTRIEGRSLGESLPIVQKLFDQSNVETTGRGIPSA